MKSGLICWVSAIFVLQIPNIWFWAVLSFYINLHHSPASGQGFWVRILKTLNTQHVEEWQSCVGTSEWEGEIQVQQEQLSAKFISILFYFPAGSFISSGNLSSWHLHEELGLNHHGTMDILLFLWRNSNSGERKMINSLLNCSIPWG